MKTFFKAAAISCLTLAAAPGASAMSILIDDFVDSARVEDLPGSFGTTITQGSLSVLGGTRTLAVDTSPDSDPLADSAASVLVSTASKLSFSNAVGHIGVATVTYNGGGLGLGDLTGVSGTNDRFFFSDIFGDLTGTTLKITVDTASGVNSFLEPLGPGTSNVTLFSKFGTADFTSVNSLVFEFTAVENFDGSVGAVSVVPLPASALLLVGGLGGLFGVSAVGRRRRRKEA